jgi:ankyrin repeat protein
MSKTDIHEVVKGGNLARVKELLAANPSYFNSRTEAGVTPLPYEAGYGHKEIGAELKVPGAKAQTYGVIITFIVH